MEEIDLRFNIYKCAFFGTLVLETCHILIIIDEVIQLNLSFGFVKFILFVLIVANKCFWT